MISIVNFRFTPAKFFSEQPPEKKIDNLAQYKQISPKTLDILRKKGFTDLLKIQKEMLDPIMNNENVVGRDVTGSGKTLAFIIPILESLRNNKLIPKTSFTNPCALVVVPTRELVIQVIFRISRKI